MVLMHRMNRAVPAVRASLLAASLALGGCAAAPPPTEVLTAPVQVQTTSGAPRMVDGRAAFRSTFCSVLRAEGVVSPGDLTCDRWLWRLSDEPAGDLNRVVPLANPERLEVVLVTGAFSECVGETSRPYSAGAARLQAAGAKVRTVVVGGRSGTSHNARQIADALAASQIDRERRVILIGYSKGGLDILRFLVDFPDLAARVDAVVGVASPVFGTPLADLAEPAYAALVAKMPYDKCPPGDGEVIASLTPDAATQWLYANPLPADVRFYSLAAFTTREHVARALVPFWKHLGGTDVRNDGQVVATDAVIPGSTLLGYANADHWGVAQTIETEHPVLAARQDPALFPLEQLFVAMVAFIADDLAQNARSRPGTVPAANREGER
jgi:pimeloyl-ACP methyl ester carboxylesterase